MSGYKPTESLAEFRRAEHTDPNHFWRLNSGDHQNLLDDALDALEQIAGLDYRGPLPEGQAIARRALGLDGDS